MDDNELILSFNKEVGNSGWTSSRATYLSALHNELKSRFDSSAIIKNGSMFIKERIFLNAKKIEIENK